MVHSSVASPGELPTRRFAARCAKRSIAPPGVWRQFPQGRPVVLVVLVVVVVVVVGGRSLADGTQSSAGRNRSSVTSPN